MNNGIIKKENININNKIYAIQLYINRKNIVFELESSEKKYSNSFSLDDLKGIYNLFFRVRDDINDAFSDFNYLLKENFSIEEGKGFANYIIHSREENITFHLIEIKEEEIKIDYNSLTPEMKEIINKDELILGIDFGTTFSCASVILDDKIIVIENSLGKRTTPSFVLFLDDGKICAGELAKLQPSYQKNIIYNIKRLIGKNFNDEGFQLIKKNLDFKIKEDDNFDLLKIQVFDREYYPEQISAMILKKIIYDSEHYLSLLLGKKIKIKNSVITVPAYFNEKQRNSLLNAANIINLNVKKILDEPTAASLTYLYKNKMNIEKTIIVIDFGGGTFDITLLYLRQTKETSYVDILCTGGDSNFGGEDFDYVIMKECILSIKKENNYFYKDIFSDQNIRLKRACENAKIRLSTIEKTRIFIEEYLPSINIDYSLTKEDFEKICNPLFEKFNNIISKFLKDNNIDIKNIDEVIPVGGSIFIPKIKEILKNIFGNNINYSLNPKEVVAEGAAIQGGILSKIKSLDFYNLLDITNKSSIQKNKKPKNSLDFINELKQMEKFVEYVDIKLYQDTIKDLIIEAEDCLTKLNRKKDINIKIIMEENKLILEKFGNFICNLIKQNKIEKYEQNLILSYIKYYFNKLADFFQTYKDDSFKSKIIKENIIDIILKEIEFYNSNIIFEIIEDFSDDREIFEKCIIALIQNLYGKFTLNSEKKDFKKIEIFELEMLENEVDNILNLFNKLISEEIPIEIKYVPNYLRAFKFKIQVKKFILDYRKRTFTYGFQEKLDIFAEFKYLSEEYKKSLNIDENLMNELNDLIPDSRKEIIYNKCDLFLGRDGNLQNKSIFEKEEYLYHIFKEFKAMEISELSNGNDTKFRYIDLTMKWKNCDNDARDNIQLEINSLNEILIKYNKSYELIKEKFKEEKLEKVYQKIISEINLVKESLQKEVNK